MQDVRDERKEEIGNRSMFFLQAADWVLVPSEERVVRKREYGKNKLSSYLSKLNLQSLYNIQVECIVQKRALGSKMYFVPNTWLLIGGLTIDEAVSGIVKLIGEGISRSYSRSFQRLFSILIVFPSSFILTNKCLSHSYIYNFCLYLEELNITDN